MWGLGVACILFSLLPIAMTVLAGHDKDFWAKVLLFVGFAVGGIYCLMEAALVRGAFDDEGIRFKTPWTGEKIEKWCDLESIDFNAACSWYTLSFRSGAKIRLSSYLNGHASALDAAEWLRADAAMTKLSAELRDYVWQARLKSLLSGI